MKTALSRFGWVAMVTLALALVAISARDALGGSIDPPGPPASTMQSLDNIPGSWSRWLPSSDGGGDGCGSSRFACVIPTAHCNPLCVFTNDGVLDHETGLVWTRDASVAGTAIWSDAYRACLDLKTAGLWDEVMIADLKYFDGNLARIDRVPPELRRLYATAFEIDPSWLVEAAARRQKWIDQAQSLNIYMANASGRKLDETYKLAWVRGLKTTYYLRSMGATHAEKSTVKAGQLNAVPTEAAGTAMAGDVGAEPKFCSIDNPECEACQ